MMHPFQREFFDSASFETICSSSLMATVVLLFIPLPAVALEDQESVEQIEIAAMPSGRYNFNHPHSHIYWTVNHAGMSNTHGRFSDFDGTLNFNSDNPGQSQFEVIIDMGSVDTDVPDLDADLISENFFDVKQFPEARFVLTGFVPGGDNAGKMQGELTMHGVTKPVTLDVTLNGIKPKPKDRKWTRMGYTATTSIDRLEFGMNRFEDIIGHDVQITIDVEFLIDLGDQ